jgi:predicted AAA+ superfamily ATPase
VAITNQERVGKAMDLLRQGLAPFVEREVQSRVKIGAVNMDTVRRFSDDPVLAKKPIAQWDVAGVLRLMWECWNEVFRATLGVNERNLVSELRGWRNKWAHQEKYSSRDTERALDSAARLLAAISAPEAEEIERIMLDLRRLTFEEQVRNEKKKVGGSLIESAAVAATLKPWRDVVAPHADVASGRYQQAEFAADLWQVHIGQGTSEYRDPKEFFRRTFLTESLKRLLTGAIERVHGDGGDPVVQLQTNFGGGKTHSMLALYHLFSGAAVNALQGVGELMAETGRSSLPKVKRVVLVGNKISPGNPSTKSDGTVVHTLWGELAWQLGGKRAFNRIAKDDERATSPGDVLRELFVEYGPCLILIDEWVAYARQLHDQSDLPGGSFETTFTFAQVLTESAKLAGNCLLVVSLPASDTTGSPHTQADDVEVGGIRGREALDRLRNVVGRVESTWKPATAEEGFEIVRRRLFDAIPGDQFTNRDLTARAFSELYRVQASEFPPECRTADYERRLQAAYPIHPEVFDRLYSDWSTLVKFQRTRGVLRLMAAVIHCLWEKGDRNPMILPSTIPIDDPRVQFELTRYLSDAWTPIIERDVDGPQSLPLRIDNEQPNLGRLHAARRVARTVYLGSAPTQGAAHRGLEDRRVTLGCVMPGEPPAIFGDALRRLASSATYLYQDGTRVWYATQPTVTKLAEDRTEQFKREADRIYAELETLIKNNAAQSLRDDDKKKIAFARLHVFARTGADVPDDHDARLVVLPPDQMFSKDGTSAAETAARALLESRGNSPRLFRNTLVFLAADKARMQDLEDAVARSLAWRSIIDDHEVLDLGKQQTHQALTQSKSAEAIVAARIPETYQWLLIPIQGKPQDPVTLQATRLSGSESLAERASKKLKSEELLIASLGPTILRKHLDDVPLWPEGHVAVGQLLDYFATYIYLPRVASSHVLLHAIQDGLKLLTWPLESFALADRFDASANRYQGLRAGQNIAVSADSAALLVQPQLASRQLDTEVPNRPVASATLDMAPGGDQTASPNGGDQVPLVRRFFGTVTLDPTRVGRDAGRIAEEIVSHLVGQSGAEVTVTLEIAAELPDGASDQVVRTVTENSRTLKFDTHGFERE